MSFLICDKCGCYYKLQEGKSIDDFEGCSCGGKFRVVENLEDYNSTIKDDKDNITKKII